MQCIVNVPTNQNMFGILKGRYNKTNARITSLKKPLNARKEVSATPLAFSTLKTELNRAESQERRA